jgi:hypothetical protein
MAAIMKAHDGDIQVIDCPVAPGINGGANSEENGGGRCVDRSRGGLATRVHGLVETCGLPARFALTPAQARD